MTRTPPAPVRLAALLALAAAGCSRSYASLSPAQVCSSDQTLGRIRRALFDQAGAQASSETRYALEGLSRQVQAKLVRPLVESYDRDTRKTSCAADLDVWLPTGVARPRELESSIRYDSQPTADERDVVFDVSGLEQVADGIAGADLGAWAQAHAPRKPGLVVEVAPPSTAPMRLAQAQSPVAQTTPPPPVAPAAADGPVRVFVHVADPSELAGADRVRAELTALDISGAPVAAPPTRLVAAMPRRTEVRCLKRADCPAARRVAAYLAGRLGGPVAVVDMSGTYEDDPGVRRGSLELWLRQPA